MLEAYDETDIFIPVETTEDAVQYFARKLSGSYVPGGTYSETLQGWF